MAAPRFDSPFNSPTRSSPESEQPFHSLSSSEVESEKDMTTTEGRQPSVKTADRLVISFCRIFSKSRLSGWMWIINNLPSVCWPSGKLKFVTWQANLKFFCLRYSSVWKLLLQNHSCYIPSESSWHQEAKNHHIFCVASNDATLWIKINLTLFSLFEL